MSARPPVDRSGATVNRAALHLCRQRNTPLLPPLMFTKGSTAIECGGGVNVRAVVSTLGAVPEEAEGAAMCFEIQNQSKTKYASARITTVPITATAKFAPRAAQPIRLIAGAAADSPPAGARMAVDVSGDSRRCTRSMR